MKYYDESLILSSDFYIRCEKELDEFWLFLQQEEYVTYHTLLVYKSLLRYIHQFMQRMASLWKISEHDVIKSIQKRMKPLIIITFAKNRKQGILFTIKSTPLVMILQEEMKEKGIRFEITLPSIRLFCEGEKLKDEIVISSSSVCQECHLCEQSQQTLSLLPFELMYQYSDDERESLSERIVEHVRVMKTYHMLFTKSRTPGWIKSFCSELRKINNIFREYTFLYSFTQSLDKGVLELESMIYDDKICLSKLTYIMKSLIENFELWRESVISKDYKNELSIVTYDIEQLAYTLTRRGDMM